MLSEFINPFNDRFMHLGIPENWDYSSPSGLQALNNIVSQQAELIAYIQDFRFLGIIILCCIPVVLLMQNPLKQAKA